MITRQGTRISVTGSVNFGNVRQALAEGLAEIASGAAEVDLSKLENADSSAIGMMLEWLRAAKKHGGTLSFHDMKQELQSLVRLYGLSIVLGQGADNRQ